MIFHRSLPALGWSLHGGGFLLTIGIAIGAWSGIDKFVNGRIQHLERRHAATERFMRTQPEVAAENLRLQTEIADRSSRFAELLARIPPDARESDYLAQVSELAGRCALNIRDYRPGSIAAQSRHHELDIALAADGNYAALCHFLQGIHTLPRLSRVTVLQVTAPLDMHAATYPIDMTLRIYCSQLQSAQ